METWGAAIGAICAIVLLLLKAYQAKAPQRTEAARNEEIQKGRDDIASGDAGAVSERVDRLLQTAAGDPSGCGSDQDTARRLDKITRL